uniref:Uncharacterized protein n=1 Tax=Globodera rostochiensis TaxID=31243 RepID=A0A914I513_GLORO
MTRNWALLEAADAAITVPSVSKRATVHRLTTANWHNWHCHLVLLLLTITFCALFGVSNASIHRMVVVRNRRQTPASSSGTVDSVGNKTSMSASNALWKATDGTVGANGTSTGMAGGQGPSNVVAGSNATVGNSYAGGLDTARAIGTQSQSAGSSSSMLNGAQSSQSGTASGSAVGSGNARVDSVGGGSLTNWTQPSQRVGVVGIGGATGNQMAAANSSNTYSMSWNSIFAKVSGISMSKGENNSQANVDLRAGSPTTNLSVDGLVSGVNDKPGGTSFSLVAGDGTLMNNSAAVHSALVGAVNTTSGGSKMVGASNLESAGTLNKGALNTFGELRLNGTGPGMGGFLSNSSINPDGTPLSAVAISGMEMGGNKSISVNDGINSNVGSAAPVALLGRGNLEGTGNVASNGSSFVLTGYQTGNGTGQVIDTMGKSMATNNTPSELRINNQGIELAGNTTTTNASSNAIGKVMGQSSSVQGNSLLELARQGQFGSSDIVAQGGGAGPSNAMTDTGLRLNGPNNTIRNSNIHGNVNANGDQTFVQSVSNVSDQNKQQSLFNSQNATVNSAGKGQASASNSVVLKRRRRHSRSLATLTAMEAKDWWESVPMAKSAEENNLYVHKRRRRHSRNLDIMAAKNWRPRE